jgi:signal transduction histidine kinase
MSRISPEHLEAKLPPARHDEIGLLQESFRGMLHRLRKSEEERQRAEDELIRSDRLATIGKIVAGVAHEVNNPLAALSACVYNLEPRLPGDLRKYADILKNGTQRIETIVRQLTDFSRSGELFLQPVHSDQFFKEASAFGSMALKKHRISFMATDTAPSTVLSIDKGKMHQVALNLLLNAADASPPGGTVELLAHREGNWYCLSVKDQGMGIPEEAREHIFEIFYTTKPPGKGTGIGLAICKTIVEMHHGEIAFVSKPGQTTFVTRIPIAKEETDGEP